MPHSRSFFGHRVTNKNRDRSMNPTYPGLIAAALYLVGGFLQFNVLFRQAGPSVRVIAMVALPAVLLHGIAAVWLLNTAAGIDLSLFPMLCLTTFILAASVVLGATRLPLQNLFVFIFPLCACGCALAVIAATGLADSTTPIILAEGLAIHVLLSVAAYTLLAVAACQSILLQVQERHLHTKHTFALTRVLPPLETMESLLFQLVWFGFVLLSASIISGFVYLEDMFAKHVAHHTVFALMSWLAFATLLVGRYSLGWRGTTAVRWTLVGFVLLVLGYLGSKVVREVILG